MAFGDRRYRMLVPQEVQDFIEDEGLPLPDSFVDAPERPPYLPYSARAILFGDLLPEDLARELGVPVDVGRLPVADHEPNGTNGRSSNGGTAEQPELD
jgi:hypothetical protein